MTKALKKAWAGVTGRAELRERETQVAALCIRDGEAGAEVLLITSRDTGRWVIPKGWPMQGRSNAEAALQEAWEEAGVQNSPVEDTPCGFFDYDKRLDDGAVVPVTTQVFKVQVSKLSDIYPEAKQRTRKWTSAAKAATLVDEPELKALLRRI